MYLQNLLREYFVIDIPTYIKQQCSVKQDMLVPLYVYLVCPASPVVTREMDVGPLGPRELL